MVTSTGTITNFKECHKVQEQAYILQEKPSTKINFRAKGIGHPGF